MKFALIGKNISHSRSPVIYHYLFKNSISYDVLDISDQTHLPTLNSLAGVYNGINLTTPYKSSYVDQVEILDPVLKDLKAINCLKFINGRIVATNTDYLALKDLLKLRHLNSHLLILGNGVMASLLLRICKDFKISHEHLHRQNGLTEFYEFRDSAYKNIKSIIVNCCDRGFSYQGEGNRNIHFWDLNYSFIPHQSTLPFKFKSYIDGQELLWKQAQMAMKFWLEK